MKSVIYILSNPSMEGLLKIGYSTKPLEERVSELSGVTGVPTDFVVEAFFEVDRPEEVEKQVHRALRRHRVREQREFFRLSVAEAIKITCQICRSPPTKNTRTAPGWNADPKRRRWLGYEKAEFDAIRRAVWQGRKATFEKEFLTDPDVPIPAKTFSEKVKRLCFGGGHSFRGASHHKGSLKAVIWCILNNCAEIPVEPSRLEQCSRIVSELGGYFGVLSRSGIVLHAGRHSIAAVTIRSAVDMHPERIRQILVRLQDVEREIYLEAKDTYEKRYQQALPL